MRRKLLHFLANNVFGLLALFVALGGTAYAVNTVAPQTSSTARSSPWTWVTLRSSRPT